MNDASNIIITNNQSKITRVKFGKFNNKKSNTNDKSNIAPKISNPNSNNKDIQTITIIISMLITIIIII